MHAVEEWLGLAVNVSDDEARQYAALKFGVDPERVELLRDDGCVKVRVMEQDNAPRSQN